MFYFNDNIYIVENFDSDFHPENYAYGDSWDSFSYATCHKYSLKDKKYYKDVFLFPKSWYACQEIFRSNYGNLVSIDRYNEFFLVVAGNISSWRSRNNVKGKNNEDGRRFLFFTEKEGFQEIRQFRSKQRNTRNLKNKITKQINTKRSIIFAPHKL